jgi:hypothetical protein
MTQTQEDYDCIATPFSAKNKSRVENEVLRADAQADEVFGT